MGVEEEAGADPRGASLPGTGLRSPVWVGVCCWGGEQTCVGAGVPLEFVAPCEPLSTEEPVADEGPLARVQAHVVTQSGRLAEAAIAKAAHEGLVQRVDAHVRAQVAARVEAAMADDAAHATRGARSRVRGMEIL